MEKLRAQGDTKTLTQVEVDEKVSPEHEIVLFNDEVNTFDWVIVSLMEVCEHEVEQAQQCAMLTHYKGKCGVKTGELKKLKPMCQALLDRGLSAELL